MHAEPRFAGQFKVILRGLARVFGAGFMRDCRGRRHAGQASREDHNDLLATLLGHQMALRGLSRSRQCLVPSWMGWVLLTATSAGGADLPGMQCRVKCRVKLQHLPHSCRIVSVHVVKHDAFTADAAVAAVVSRPPIGVRTNELTSIAGDDRQCTSLASISTDSSASPTSV